MKGSHDVPTNLKKKSVTFITYEEHRAAHSEGHQHYTGTQNGENVRSHAINEHHTHKEY